MQNDLISCFVLLPCNYFIESTVTWGRLSFWSNFSLTDTHCNTLMFPSMEGTKPAEQVLLILSNLTRSGTWIEFLWSPLSLYDTWNPRSLMHTWCWVCAHTWNTLFRIHVVDTHPHNEAHRYTFFSTRSLSALLFTRKLINLWVKGVCDKAWRTCGARNCVAVFTTTFGMDPEIKENS